MLFYYHLLLSIIIFKNHAENKAGRLVTDLFLFCKKSLYDEKSSGLQPSFNMF